MPCCPCAPAGSGALLAAPWPCCASAPGAVSPPGVGSPPLVCFGLAACDFALVLLCLRRAFPCSWRVPLFVP
eukprot:10107448-Alexandrium_andersonii.AAC.1